MQGPFIHSLLGYELLFFIIMNLFWISLYYFSRKKGKKRIDLSKKPLVSVIIPVFNKSRHLKGTINSALKLRYEPKEIIVVNDGSKDDSEKICSRYEKKGLIRFLNFKRNRGKAHALNSGVKASKGDLILSIDADSFVSSNSLNRMVRHFEDSKMGAGAGVVKVRRKRGVLNKLQIIEYLHQAFQRLVQGFFDAVLVLPGPLSLYRKTAVLDAGGFEDATLVEDWDITMKIHKNGYKIVSEKRASADTIAPETVRKWWHQRVRWSRGGIQIARRHTDVIGNSENKALTRLVFPLHVMWLIVPMIVIPTFIILMVPSQVMISGFIADLTVLFSMISEFFVTGTTSIAGMFSVIDKMIFNIVDLTNLGWVRFLGYSSGIAFVWFTYTSIKSIEKNFTPKHFLSLILMPVYWMMLNIVYLQSLALEIIRGEMKW
ncbi:MAG: glycosyltransferase [Candidatus Aenigmatarchaeota archaeon]|nr:MAG: glycosyltransferase [Candidatus Aenigmarchaeota archaeon]